MSETLTQMYRMNLWANLTLLDFCSSLSDEQLDTTAPGTMGSIRKTFIHILANEEGYLQLITGRSPETSLWKIQGFPGFEDLKSRAKWGGEEFIHLAETLSDDRVLRGVRREEQYAIRAAVPMLQCIHHGIEHRTQIKSILSQMGIEPPELDAWSFGEENLKVE